MFEKVIKILDKNIDQGGLVRDVLLEIVEPKIRELAAKTENKIDDIAVEVLINAIKKALA